jgi:hypothetical protein
MICPLVRCIPRERKKTVIRAVLGLRMPDIGIRRLGLAASILETFVACEFEVERSRIRGRAVYGGQWARCRGILWYVLDIDPVIAEVPGCEHASCPGHLELDLVDHLDDFFGGTWTPGGWLDESLAPRRQSW